MPTYSIGKLKGRFVISIMRLRTAANNHGHRRARHRSPTDPKEVVTWRSTNMQDSGSGIFLFQEESETLIADRVRKRPICLRSVKRRIS